MREQRIKQFEELQEHILLLDYEIKKAECIDIKDYKKKKSAIQHLQSRFIMSK